jgi:hypothetical protein
MRIDEAKEILTAALLRLSQKHDYADSGAANAIATYIETYVTSKLRSAATPSEGEKERKAPAPVAEAGEMPDVLPAGTKSISGEDLSGFVWDADRQCYKAPNYPWWVTPEYIDRSTLPDARGGERAAATTGRRHFVCGNCGEHARVDEDACCGTCGADCTIAECKCERRRASNPEPPKAAEVPEPDPFAIYCHECGGKMSGDGQDAAANTWDPKIHRNGEAFPGTFHVRCCSTARERFLKYRIPKPPESPPVPDAGGKSDEELRAIEYKSREDLELDGYSLVDAIEEGEKLARRAIYNAGRADKELEAEKSRQRLKALATELSVKFLAGNPKEKEQPEKPEGG